MDLSHIQSIDLTKMDRETMKSYAAHLEVMLASAGWKLLETVLKANLEVLTEQIVSKVNTGGEPLTDADVEILRVQYAQIRQLLDKPRTLITQFHGKPNIGHTAEYDPYQKAGVKSEFVNNAESMAGYGN